MRLAIFQSEHQSARRWASYLESGMELQQSRDEGSTILQDCVFHNFHLRCEMGLAEQIRFPLQPRGELLEFVFIDRREYFAHDDRLPGADDGLPWANVLLR